MKNRTALAARCRCDVSHREKACFCVRCGKALATQRGASPLVVGLASLVLLLVTVCGFLLGVINAVKH